MGTRLATSSDAKPKGPSLPGSRTARRYRADIDGLRGIAVLMVVTFHFRLMPGADAGFLGVDVFFVISGFLISSIIVPTIRDGSFALGAFYVNRIRRLAPALLVTMLGAILASAALLLPSSFEAMAEQMLVTQFYVSNVYLWRTINYFGLQAEGVHLLHAWSLAVEEQFYLLYPIGLLIVARLRVQWFWRAIVLAAVCSFVLNLVMAQGRPEATFYLLPTRAWELLAGALTFLILESAPRLEGARAETLAVTGLALIGVSVFAHQPDFSVPGAFAFVPVFGAAAVIYSGTHAATGVGRILGLPAFVYVGRLSYPLYLVHWPIEVFARDLLGEDYSVPMRWAMFGFSLVLAAAIYHGVETPIRNRRLLTSDRTMLLGYGAAMLATIGLYWGATATGGFPGRFSDEIVAVMAFESDHTPSQEACRFDSGRSLAEVACVVGAKNREPSWLVYGDSHAWAAAAIIEQWLLERGESGFFVFRTSCPPVLDIDLYGSRGECRAFNDQARALVAETNSIRGVFMISTWRQAIEGVITDRPFSLLGVEESVALFQAKFGETVRHYRDQGLRVHVWAPVPGAVGHPPKALARGMLLGNADAEASLAMPLARYRESYAFFFDAVAANESAISVLYEPERLLCDETSCTAILDGRPVYFDGTHITASLWPRWLALLQAADAASTTR